jgi:hypothetical protein
VNKGKKKPTGKAGLQALLAKGIVVEWRPKHRSIKDALRGAVSAETAPLCFYFFLYLFFPGQVLA